MGGVSRRRRHSDLRLPFPPHLLLIQFLLAVADPEKTFFTGQVQRIALFTPGRTPEVLLGVGIQIHFPEPVYLAHTNLLPHSRVYLQSVPGWAISTHLIQLECPRFTGNFVRCQDLQGSDAAVSNFGVLDWPCGENQRLPRTNVLAGVVLHMGKALDVPIDIAACRIMLFGQHLQFGRTTTAAAATTTTSTTTSSSSSSNDSSSNDNSSTGVNYTVHGYAHTPARVRATVLESGPDPSSQPRMYFEDGDDDDDAAMTPQEADALPTSLLQSKMTMGDMLRAIPGASMIVGPVLDETMGPVLNLAMVPVGAAVGQVMTQGGMNQKAEEAVPHPLAMMLQQVLSANLTNLLSDALAFELPSSLTRRLVTDQGSMARSMIEPVDKLTRKAIGPAIQNILSSVIPRRLSRWIPETLERSLHIGLTQTLTRSLAHALTNTISRGVGTSRSGGAGAAGSTSGNAMYTSYYSAYYSDYYSDFYADYYTTAAIHEAGNIPMKKP